MLDHGSIERRPREPSSTVEGVAVVSGAATTGQEPIVRADLFRFIEGDGFSCVAAKTALKLGTIVHRHYGMLAERTTTATLHGDLCRFVEAKDSIHEVMASFIATFSGPLPTLEEEFEKLLWQQLQALHDLDTRTHPWAPGTDSDPSSPKFAFSVSSHPFFVVGMHKRSSRRTRAFPWPTLVFNSHVQFDRLRERRVYPVLKADIRRRELLLQGSLNPNLADFGESAESRQYSGRAVPADWTCPFASSVEGEEA